MSRGTRVAPRDVLHRVVLVDDHALVRHGLRSLLESTGAIRVVGEAGDARTALETVIAQRPDVVLLDLRLGEQDGMQVARACRDTVPEARVLVVSAHGGSAELRRAFAEGADGFLLKGVTADQLVDAITRVAAGETVVDPEFMPALLDQIAGGGHESAQPTVREMEVLSLVADGMTAHEAAGRLGVSGRTVQKHLENLYRKLGVSNRAELVQQAFRRGLLR